MRTGEQFPLNPEKKEKKKKKKKEKKSNTNRLGSSYNLTSLKLATTYL